MIMSSHELLTYMGLILKSRGKTENFIIEKVINHQYILYTHMCVCIYITCREVFKHI